MSIPDPTSVDARGVLVSLDVADDLAVLTIENAVLVIDASHARRLADELIPCADAIDALQPNADEAL